VWNELARPLADAKLLTEVDVPMLAMACVSISQYRYAVSRTGDALVKIKLEKSEEGALVETGEHINPWAMIQSMTFKQAMVVLREFGMSPAARSRVAIQPQGDLFGKENPAAKYF
jgi:P27 family predicted phage terminase small subunit